jgi:hypothetical protein
MQSQTTKINNLEFKPHRRWLNRKVLIYNDTQYSRFGGVLSGACSIVSISFFYDQRTILIQLLGFMLVNLLAFFMYFKIACSGIHYNSVKKTMKIVDNWRWRNLVIPVKDISKFSIEDIGSFGARAWLYRKDGTKLKLPYPVTRIPTSPRKRARKVSESIVASLNEFIKKENSSDPGVINGTNRR